MFFLYLWLKYFECRMLYILNPMYTKSSIKMSILDVEYHFKKLDNTITIIVMSTIWSLITHHTFSKKEPKPYILRFI